MKAYETMEALKASGLVAVIRGDSHTDAINYSEACIRGGIKGIEITFTTPSAHKALEYLHEEYGDSIALGAGSVLDHATARIAMLSGAKYIVSPHFDSETAKLCNRYRIPYIPGCMTIKEIVTALESGASAIKLFPGSAFGPSYVKAILGPLPQAEIMPTGGVNIDNVKDWIANGCEIVGVGSALSKGSVEDIEAHAKAFVAEVKKAKGIA